jgi:SAM-dependent methyltransferase
VRRLIPGSAAARVRAVATDLADVSIDQARGRWQQLPRGKQFPANFEAMDCFTDSIANHLDPDKLERPFDTVSMQFCMHYAFQSLAKARVMLENVTRFLRPGGVFLGTIPNSVGLLCVPASSSRAFLSYSDAQLRAHVVAGRRARVVLR